MPQCARCHAPAYHVEQVVGPAGKIYHKACLKCLNCGKRLDSHLLVEHDDEVCPPRLSSVLAISLASAADGQYTPCDSPTARIVIFRCLGTSLHALFLLEQLKRRHALACRPVAPAAAMIGHAVRIPSSLLLRADDLRSSLLIKTQHSRPPTFQSSDNAFALVGHVTTQGVVRSSRSPCDRSVVSSATAGPAKAQLYKHFPCLASATSGASRKTCHRAGAGEKRSQPRRHRRQLSQWRTIWRHWQAGFNFKGWLASRRGHREVPRVQQDGLSR